MGDLLQFPQITREGGHKPAEVEAGGGPWAEAPRRITKARMLGYASSPLVDLIEKYTRARVASGEVSRDTAYAQRLTLLGFAATFGQRQVKMMGESDVLRWMEDVEANRPSTRRKDLSVVRLFCRWLVRKGHIKRDPTMDLRGPRQPRTVVRVFDNDQVATLLEAADPRLHLATLLGVQMGLRAGEAVGLELGHIDSTHALVTGKGGHQRLVPVVHQARWALDAYLSVRGLWAGPLLENVLRPGLGMTSHTLTDLFREMCWRTGIKQAAHDGMSFHGLRRTCASHLAERGASMLEIAEFLGHASIETTRKHYTRVNARKLVAMAEGRWYGKTRLEDVG